VPKLTKSESFDSKHYWYEVLDMKKEDSPSKILFGFFVVFTVWIFFSFVFNAIQKFFLIIFKCSKSSIVFIDDFEKKLEELLDIYYKCLDDDDRQWSIEEERNCREALGDMSHKTVFDSTFDQFKSTRMGKLRLTGVHTYDLLRNNKYIQAF